MLPTLSSVSKGSLHEGAPWLPSPAASSALVMPGVPRKQMAQLTMEDLFVIADEDWFAPLPSASQMQPGVVCWTKQNVVSVTASPWVS